MATTTSELLFKVRTDVGNTAAGFKRLTSGLKTVKTDSDAAGKSLDAMGKKKTTVKVDDSEVTGAKKELDRLAKTKTDVKASVSVNDQAIARAKSQIDKLRDDIRKKLELDVTADTRPEQRQIAQLKSSIKSLTGTTQKVNVDVDVKGDDLAKLKNDINDVNDAAGDSGGKFSKLALGVAGLAAGIPFVSGLVRGFGSLVGRVGDVVTSSIELADSFENSKIAFSQFLGSTKKADAFLDQLVQFAAKTPFSFDELTGASKKLLAFGADADDVVDIMGTLGDAAALTGADVNDLATIYGQMLAKGKLGTDDLTQLVERGIPVWKDLAKATGKSVPELQKMASAGKLGTHELELLMAQMHKDYTGGMAKQAETLNGLLSTLGDTWDGVKRKFGATILPFAKIGVGEMQKGLDALSDWVTSHLPMLVDGIKSIALEAVNFPATLLRGLGFVEAGIDSIISSFQSMMASISTELGNFAITLGLSLQQVPKMGDVGDALVAGGGVLLGGAADFQKGAKEWDTKAGDASEKWGKRADAYTKAIQPVIDKINEAAEAAKKPLEIAVKTGRIDKQLEKVDSRIAKLKRERANVTLDADKKALDSKLVSAFADKKRLTQKRALVTIDADIKGSKSKVAGIKAQIAELTKKPQTAEIRGEIGALQKSLKTAKGELHDAEHERHEIPLGMNTKELHAAKRSAEKTLHDLERQKTTPKVRADITKAKASLKVINDELHKTHKQHPKPTVDANTHPANSKLDETKRKGREFANSNPTTTAHVNTSDAIIDLQVLQGKLVAFDGMSVTATATLIKKTINANAGISGAGGDPFAQAGLNSLSVGARMAVVGDQGVAVTHLVSGPQALMGIPQAATTVTPTATSIVRQQVWAPTPAITVASPPVNVVVSVQDEKLADLIDVRIDGKTVQARKVVARRQAVAI